MVVATIIVFSISKGESYRSARGEEAEGFVSWHRDKVHGITSDALDLVNVVDLSSECHDALIRGLTSTFGEQRSVKKDNLGRLITI
jgi:hypothetical protein